MSTFVGTTMATAFYAGVQPKPPAPQHAAKSRQEGVPATLRAHLPPVVVLDVRPEPVASVLKKKVRLKPSLVVYER